MFNIIKTRDEDNFQANHILEIVNTRITHSRHSQGSRKEGVKGISALIFWESASKIKMKGKSTLCSLRFQH